MVFEKMQPVPMAREIIRFGAVDAIASYIVSFDHKHPELGWRASYKRLSTNIVLYVGGKHKSKKAAITALMNARKEMVN